MGSKRVTILDVAKMAEVSIATVSRVLNNTEYPVSDELREKITKAANKLNYTPNVFGKSLKSGKSNDIGIIVPSLINPFYAEVISGIEKECRNVGYNPIFCSSHHMPENEKKYIDLLKHKCVEGILISTINEDSEYLRQLATEMNIVLFDQSITNFIGDSVTYDFYQAGSICGQYLIKKGHKNIAFLTAPFDRFSRKSIYDGFRSALKDAGTPFNEKNLFISSIEDVYNVECDEFENGRKLAKNFLEAKCEATVAVAINDITALGVIQEFIKNGKRVPEDISVIGLDNISYSAMVTPPLTTINQPSFEMGMLAVEVLINKINKKSKKNSQVLLKPTVIERESVKTINI